MIRRLTTAVALGALIATIPGCGPSGSPTPAPTPAPTPTPTPPPRINRDLKVAYIGGAVAQGQNANNFAGFFTSTTTYLTQQYRTVQARNFGVGRSGSEFGAYRVELDFGTFVPDLVFIAFAGAEENNIAQTNSYHDAIVYKLRRLNPNVAIVFVSIARETDEADRRAGRVPDRVTNLQQLATDEQALFVDVGAVLWQRIISQGVPVTTYLPEGGTPNDAGHAIYAEALRAYLDPRLEGLAGLGRVESRYIAQTHLENARIVPVSSVESHNCSTTNGGEVYLVSSLSCTAGQTFTLRFDGRNLGLIRGMVATGGTLDCTVDSAAPTSTPFNEAEVPAGRFFARPLLIYQGLTDGPHVLRCTVNMTPPPGSTGTTVTVGGFMVSSGQLLPGA